LKKVKTRIQLEYCKD